MPTNNNIIQWPLPYQRHHSQYYLTPQPAKPHRTTIEEMPIESNQFKRFIIKNHVE